MPDGQAQLYVVYRHVRPLMLCRLSGFYLTLLRVQNRTLKKWNILSAWAAHGISEHSSMKTHFAYKRATHILDHHFFSQLLKIIS